MKNTLTLEQCKTLIRVIAERGSKSARATDHALVVCLLMCGADARTWTWQDALANPIFQPFAVYEAIKNIAITKKLSIFPYNHAGFKQAHWVNTTVRLQHAVFTVGSSTALRSAQNKPLTTQEVTRRLKRYGKMAGIPAEQMSLRTLNNTHQMYLDVFGDADSFAEALDLLPPLSASTPTSPQMLSHLWGVKRKRTPRLHGLGRRSFMRTA